ncbi:MAG: pyridoxal-phosphate-dependent aminotransferase family protein [Paracoccaceae bacterium]
MSLANGRHYLAIPGPSVVPDRVLQAMHRAAPDIYDPALTDLLAGLATDLKLVVRTKSQVALYIANGHAVWEAAVANTLSPGDEVLVLATGRFAFGWAEMAARLGVKARILDFGNQAPVDSVQVFEALKEDKSHNIKAVLAVHVDTATSVKSDILAIRQAIDDAQHPALLMADCMASLGCDRFEMDNWGVDLTVAGCQKGLMTPPGMAFVFFNDKADEMRETCRNTSHYWDWRPRANPKIFSEYFDGTAPTHHLFGLRVALDMIHEEGVEQVWHRHAVLARAYWAAIDAWGNGGPIKANVVNLAHRSNAVTAIGIGTPNGTALRDWLRENAGVTLGIGLGMAEPEDPAWHGFFRIGHMGHVNMHMVLGVVGAIEAGLTSLGIPHGPHGASAAIKVCAAVEKSGLQR